MRRLGAWLGDGPSSEPLDSQRLRGNRSSRSLRQERDGGRLAVCVPRAASRPSPSPMNRLERFYKIDQLLQERTVVPRDAFLEELEVSLATFKRDLEYMRDRFNAPVMWDPDARGYRYEKKGKAGPKFALPGLWFSEDEAYALVTMQHLLASLDQGGLIGPHIAPLQARLDAIIGAGGASGGEVRKRIRLLSFGSRKLPLEHFSL